MVAKEINVSLLPEKDQLSAMQEVYLRQLLWSYGDCLCSPAHNLPPTCMLLASDPGDGDEGIEACQHHHSPQAFH